MPYRHGYGPRNPYPHTAPTMPIPCEWEGCLARFVSEEAAARHVRIMHETASDIEKGQRQ